MSPPSGWASAPPVGCASWRWCCRRRVVPPPPPPPHHPRPRRRFLLVPPASRRSSCHAAQPAVFLSCRRSSPTADLPAHPRPARCCCYYLTTSSSSCTPSCGISSASSGTPCRSTPRPCRWSTAAASPAAPRTPRTAAARQPRQRACAERVNSGVARPQAPHAVLPAVAPLHRHVAARRNLHDRAEGAVPRPKLVGKDHVRRRGNESHAEAAPRLDDLALRLDAGARAVCAVSRGDSARRAAALVRRRTKSCRSPVSRPPRHGSPNTLAHVALTQQHVCQRCRSKSEGRRGAASPRTVALERHLSRVARLRQIRDLPLKHAVEHEKPPHVGRILAQLRPGPTWPVVDHAPIIAPGWQLRRGLLLLLPAAARSGRLNVGAPDGFGEEIQKVQAHSLPPGRVRRADGIARVREVSEAPLVLLHGSGEAARALQGQACAAAGREARAACESGPPGFLFSWLLAGGRGAASSAAGGAGRQQVTSYSGAPR